MKKILLSTLLFVSALLLFNSCSKDEAKNGIIQLGESVVNVNAVGGKFSLTATSDKTITYTSKDEYVALVDNNGEVSGVFVGSTVIELKTENDTKTVKINVVPTVTLYPEPGFKYGDKKSDVVKVLGQPERSGQKNGHYFDYYSDYYSAVPLIGFSYDSQANIEAYVLWVRIGYASKIVNHLSDRYLPVGVVGENVYWVNSLDADKVSLIITVDAINTTYYGIEYLCKTLSTRGADIQQSVFYDLYEEGSKFLESKSDF